VCPVVNRIGAPEEPFRNYPSCIIANLAKVKQPRGDSCPWFARKRSGTIRNQRSRNGWHGCTVSSMVIAFRHWMGESFWLAVAPTSSLHG
jgi:hypothetical protein